MKSTKSLHFARQTSTRVSQKLQPYNLSDMTAAEQTNTGTFTALTAEKGHIHTHTTSPTLPTCDITLCSLMSSAPDAADFVELILLYQTLHSVHTQLYKVEI
jgi:hypothetical protein